MRELGKNIMADLAKTGLLILVLSLFIPASAEMMAVMTKSSTVILSVVALCIITALWTLCAHMYVRREMKESILEHLKGGGKHTEEYLWMRVSWDDGSFTRDMFEEVLRSCCNQFLIIQLGDVLRDEELSYMITGKGSELLGLEPKTE